MGLASYIAIVVAGLVLLAMNAWLIKEVDDLKKRIRNQERKWEGKVSRDKARPQTTAIPMFKPEKVYTLNEPSVVNPTVNLDGFHISHEMVLKENNHQECKNCWACTCHQMERLVGKCDGWRIGFP